MCLLSLVVTVKPLAYIVGSYARSDRQNKVYQKLQFFHPLPVASIGRGSVHIILFFDRDYKCALRPF